MYVCVCTCKDSAAPAHARTRAHIRPAAPRQCSGVSQTPHPSLYAGRHSTQMTTTIGSPSLCGRPKGCVCLCGECWGGGGGRPREQGRARGRPTAGASAGGGGGARGGAGGGGGSPGGGGGGGLLARSGEPLWRPALWARLPGAGGAGSSRSRSCVYADDCVLSPGRVGGGCVPKVRLMSMDG